MSIIFAQIAVNIRQFQANLLFLLRHSKSSMLGALSSAFEWYDYALFGYFTLILSEQFFPHLDPINALLSNLAVFASGFVMRPLGAIVFGYIGDRVGRKPALMLSLVMMALPTTLLGLLPNYQSIGILAPIALVILRMFQGLAVGGNYGGSFIFTIEHAPKGYKALAGSLATFGTLGGLFLGSGSAFLVDAIFTKEALGEYGWRIPFLLGSLSAVLAYLIRRYVPEKEYKQDKVVSTPIKVLLEHHMLDVLKAICLILLEIGIYVIFVFMNTYASVFLKLPTDAVLLTNTINMALLVVCIPLFGYLGDVYNPGKILRYVALGFATLSMPLFAWLVYGTSILALSVLQLCFAVMMGAIYGTLPIIVVYLFPRAIRYTGCSLAFNISVTIFGGTAPFIITWLIKETNNLMMPAFVLSVVGVISYIAGRNLKQYKEGQ